MEYACDDIADETADTVALLKNEISAHKQTEERLQRARDNLAVLHGISALANQSLNLPIFLTESLSRAAHALQSDMGAVLLLEGDREVAQPPSRLMLAAHYGVALERIRPVHSVAAERGIAAWIIEHREPLVIPDLAADSRFPDRMRQFGNLSLVLAPIRAEAWVLGIIGLARPRRQVYRIEEISLLSSIADQIGVVVKVDHLRKRAERAALLEERQRLARDLHDSVAQALYSVLLLADASREHAEAGDLSQTRDHVKELGGIAHQALREMRLLIYELRPQTLEREGLVGALRGRLKAVENRGGIQTQLVVEGDLAIPVAMEIDLYRFTQEALNNILRHSEATRVSLRLNAQDGRICVEIEDNGIGFELELASREEGIGLSSMHERAERMGGTLEIASRLGQGTRIRLCLPCGPRVPGKQVERSSQAIPEIAAVENPVGVQVDSRSRSG